MNYYDTCSIPKPQAQKKQKKVNGYKDKHKRYCHYCGKNHAERHEVFGASNRQASIDHGFQIDLCPEHHRELEDNITVFAQNENLKWEQHYQKKYEDKLTGIGITGKEARRLWMLMIGKNYLPTMK